MQQRQDRSIQAIVALFCWLSLTQFCWLSLAHGQDVLTARWDAVYAEIGEEISVRRKEGAKWSSYIQSNPQDAHPLIWPSDKHQCDVIVRRTEALLAAVKAMPTAPDMGALEQELAMLKSKIASQGNQPSLFREVCSVRRRIALSLPLLPDTLLFCGFAPHANIFQGAHQAATAVAHPKAGIYMATGIRSGTPSFKDFLERKTVTNGPYKDKVLSNKNASWEGKALFSGLALDYDGNRLAFAWAEASELGEEEGYHAVLRKTTRDTFHVYWTTLNGSEIYNVATHRDFDQYDPCWLPNGRIVYMSDERNAQERCGGRLPSGALFSVKADGSDPVQLSWHETNERYPSVDNEGRLVYSRWDYVDRSLYSAHNMWICYPDGRDPRAPHGNYRKHPNSTLPDKDIPISESGIKAIPGTSGKYAAVSSNHHFAHRGHLIVIDVNRSELNDNQVRDLWVDMECVNDQQYAYGDIKPFAEKRLKEHFRTPANRVKKRVFTEPWPLSEDFYLVSEFQDVFLVDKFRNEILLFDASTVVGPSLATRWVTPVCARDKPPVLPASTYQGERRTAAAADGTLEKATISVMNVYESDFEWPSPPPKITRLRIVQIIPKPKLPYYKGIDGPPAGYSNGGIARFLFGHGTGRGRRQRLLSGPNRARDLLPGA